MTTDHRAQVDELLADYRRSRDQLASVQRDLARISGSATSPDGSVTAVVDAKGTLTDLELDDRAYRLRPAQLAQLIVRTTREAVAKAAEGTYRTLSPVLPAGTDPEALLRGTADLRPEEIGAEEVLPPEPAARRRPVADDDEDFEQRDWLDADANPAVAPSPGHDPGYDPNHGPNHIPGRRPSPIARRTR
ncbi:YbaB/EbfC DNA-binding family protein [Saccharothrix carnea]|uniref:YbaB/EbfC DNA-binding family protein n=1 Tax=Saccharothrix carnea TaxID=1280637 RepID=A0A2P8I7T6_SACCR|nr:YbaB/EbfC family nucleoid-associated protein [Saccharothrix carnea]PSL54539.1 YbaB/EbfC DNA-binding family protein [Saccharothrix carnea]